ncbi:hypothetical protein BRD17_00605 [Halobacteriales archaeon SW_7_68_16]|nr:MAG: hypothetical protein BRD17_00605 [Halobacteriales archaeon SW_7_68_16]
MRGIVATTLASAAAPVVNRSLPHAGKLARGMGVKAGSSGAIALKLLKFLPIVVLLGGAWFAFEAAGTVGVVGFLLTTAGVVAAFSLPAAGAAAVGIGLTVFLLGHVGKRRRDRRRDERGERHAHHWF